MTNGFLRLFRERYLNIQWKLVLPLAGTMLVVFAVLSPLISQTMTDRIEQEADRRLGEIADSVGRLIENSEYNARTSAILISNQPEVERAFEDLPSSVEILTKEKETLRLQELSLYAVPYADGDAAYFYGGPPITRRLQVSADADNIRNTLIRRVITSGAPDSNVAIAPQNSQIIGVAPVIDPDSQQLVGVVLVAFYMDEDYIANISQIINTELAVIKDNAVIVSTIDQETGYERLIKEGWLASANLPAENIKDRTGKSFRLLGHPLEVSGVQQGHVLVAQPIDELFALSRNIQIVFYIAIAAFGLTALWFWLAAFVAFARPLAQLTEATTQISQGKFDQRVETKYFVLRDEITSLSENFNAMAEHLSDLYESLEDKVRQRTEELEEERNKLQVALDELAVARDSAVSANKSKSEFVSVVSHELKIPMTSIKGYGDLLLAGAAGQVNEAQAHFLKTIRINVNRMATLVSDLADISRIETGNLRLELKSVNLREVIKEVLDLTQNQIEQKGQTIALDLPADLPPVWADRNRLSQIVTNLVSNANKYTPAEGAILVSAAQQGEAVQIAVRDNGLGMTPEDQQKLFGKFFRSSDERVREAPGTGLGLSITKNLIELQNGKIWFESEFRKGTTFYFTVPVHVMNE